MRYHFRLSMCALLVASLSGCHSNEDAKETIPEPEQPEVPVMLTYTPAESAFGSSDASGAVALDEQFMIVADDEANVLRVYPRGGQTQRNGQLAMVAEWDYRAATGLNKELDVEALTWYQPGKLLVVGSHSNKKDGGEAVDDRGHLFAVTVSGTGAQTRFEVSGIYSGLEPDLVLWDQENRHGLGADYFGLAQSAAAGIAPENVHGFSIEGAVASADGNTLFLGFRAPQLDQRERNQALIIPVTNYLQLLDGSASEAQFGAPLELDLGGRGIRDMTRWNEEVLLIAGPAAASSPLVAQNFALYRWDGHSSAVTALDNDLDGLRTASLGSIESIVQPLTAESKIQLLLDNGDTLWPGQSQASKDLPAAQQQFQGAFLSPGAAVIDRTVPTLVKQSPAAGTVGVNTDTRIELIFDEGLRLLDGGSLVLYRGDEAVARYDRRSSELSLAFNRLIVRPGSRLDYSQIYSLRLEGELLSDSAGNRVAAGDLGLFVTAGEPTALQAGDIQFVAANAEAPDAIAFVLMKSVNGGTEIMFTDRDYSDSEGTFWNSKTAAPALNEGVFRWTADRNLKAGDIITIQTDTALSPVADIGQVLGSPSGLGKEETIYAMVGTQVDDLDDGYAGVITETGTFLAAITLGGQSGSDIPAAIADQHLAFMPSSGKADQTNALFDVALCGRSAAEIGSNLQQSSCWQVTFKSDGASGFPLYDNGSLFAEPQL